MHAPAPDCPGIEQGQILRRFLYRIRLQKRFQEESVEPQIPRFARDLRRVWADAKRGSLPRQGGYWGSKLTKDCLNSNRPSFGDSPFLEHPFLFVIPSKVRDLRFYELFLEMFSPFPGPKTGSDAPIPGRLYLKVAGIGMFLL